MKTVRDVMGRPPVWVNPEHSIESAIILLRGHRLSGLPVMRGDALVGLIEYRHLVGAAPEATVSSVMSTTVGTITADAPLRQAAEILAGENGGMLAVLEGGRLVGTVAPKDLLAELGRSYDPLTQLAWSDSMREWAIEALASGREITIIFFDLDRFGMFNKRFSHLVGDQVLQRVAATMRDLTDTSVDFLCRYGGDEFAIATVRRREEAEELAGRVADRVASIRISGVTEAITTSYGYYGGKRTREREHVHFAATLDNLINLASRACMAMKAPAQDAAQLPVDEQHPAVAQRPFAALRSVTHSVEGNTARVTVDLDVFGRSASASLTASTRPEQAIELVAQATAAALLDALPNDHDIVVRSVTQQAAEPNHRVVTVTATYVIGKARHDAVGASMVAGDMYRAAAEALLAAVQPFVPHDQNNAFLG